MRRVTGAYACWCTVVVVIGVLLALRAGESVWIPLSACLVLTLTALSAIQALNRFQSRVWRVSISGRHLSVQSVTRRKKTVGWGIVQRVLLSDAGISVIARRDDGTEARLSISEGFADYVGLSHRIAHEADRWNVPIWVDGLRLEHANVYALYPTLREDLTSGTSRGHTPLA